MEDINTIETVAVDPDMRFYNLLESYPYTPHSALCEFVDNALQAFIDAKATGLLTEKEKLNIEIQFCSTGDEESLTIRDYGVGIARSEIQKALKPALKKMDNSLSEFGIGMKAAAIWFGRKWELSSSPRSKDDTFKIEFDLDRLLNSGESTVPILNRAPIQYGVEIKITNLKNKIHRRIVDDTWRKIQETYFIYTHKDSILNLSLSFNGTQLAEMDFHPDSFFEPLLYSHVALAKNLKTQKMQSYSYGEAITWKRDVNFQFNGKKVEGFLSILKVSSQKSNPGIRLYRFKRLIRGFDDTPYRPISLVGTANKHAPSRVYGELHLDGQPISNHKGDFQFDEVFFLETLMMQEGIKELIDQAENYRATDVSKELIEHFKTYDDFILATKLKRKKKEAEKQTTKQRNKKKDTDEKNNNSTPLSHRPVDTLNSINISSNLALLHTIRDETIGLYNIEKWWPFCLCYRIVLEVGILEKLNANFSEHYNRACDKSIEALLKHLSTHRADLIDPVKYKALSHCLRDGGGILTNLPGIAILNLSAHGNFQPSRSDVDALLTNTQSLLEWTFE